MLIITESIHSIYTEYHCRIFTEGYEQSYQVILEKLLWREKECTTKNDIFFIFEGKIGCLKKKLKIALMEAVVKGCLWLIATFDIIFKKK